MVTTLKELQAACNYSQPIKKEIIEIWILAICPKSRSCMTTVLTVQTTNRNNNTYM
jgi:hypothetical protein